MNSERPSSETIDQTLTRIDREIEELLREGKLSPLNYDLPFDQLAKINRRKNLKSLLTARQSYRQMRSDAD